MNFEPLENDLHIILTENVKNNLQKFTDIFKEYNLHTNLVSKGDINVLFEKHIYDSLALSLFFQKYEKPKNILDIGTGGGFPSIPLAICYPNIKIYAIDSINKKINFIKQIKKELQLSNLEVYCERIENSKNIKKQSFDMVVSRAVSEVRCISEYSLPFLKNNGYCVLYKSLNLEEELNNTKNLFKILNSQIIDKIPYELPLKENYSRILLIIKKLGNIPDIYPRKNGLVIKKPL